MLPVISLHRCVFIDIQFFHQTCCQFPRMNLRLIPQADSRSNRKGKRQIFYIFHGNAKPLIGAAFLLDFLRMVL